MASTSVVFDILARDNASAKFNHLGNAVDGSSTKMSKFHNVMVTAGKAAAYGLGAGLVIAALPELDEKITINSKRVERLEGAIYVPNAILEITGTTDVARQSAWTVIVAASLMLTGSPNVFINADYGASDVPVPGGVGPRPGGSRLIN